MSIEVKVGQVWRDKDKRRGTVIEIIDTFKSDEHGTMAVGLVVGTEEEREYKVERLVKRWDLREDKTQGPEEIDDLVSSLDPEFAEVVEKLDPAEGIYTTREAWLQDAVKKLGREVFEPVDIEIPETRVSVGWPGGRGKKTGVIGQCFATKTVGDKVAAIFVSPVLDKGPDVVTVLAHELIHAIDDCESGHKKNFVRIAKLIGFTPKWTVATQDVTTDELKAKVNAIAGELGPYPHSAIKATERPTVQKTYMLKVLCVEDPEYFVRMTQTKLDEYGAPLCPCHHEEMEVEEK